MDVGKTARIIDAERELVELVEAQVELLQAVSRMEPGTPEWRGGHSVLVELNADIRGARRRLEVAVLRSEGRRHLWVVR